MSKSLSRNKAMYIRVRSAKSFCSETYPMGIVEEFEISFRQKLMKALLTIAKSFREFPLKCLANSDSTDIVKFTLNDMEN